MVYTEVYFLQKYFENKLTKNIRFSQIVTKRSTENQGVIRASADQFVANVHKHFSKYEPKEVINTDQSGIKLHLHCTQTLSYKGEKVTVASVHSTDAAIHDYTVQPTITLDDHLLSLTYLCLKELKGYISKNIRSHLFKTSNVVTTCSSTERLTTPLIEYWSDHVLLPSLAERKKFLLISDCWGGQEDGKRIYNHIPGCTRLEIPKKTTAEIQSLDVFSIGKRN